MNEKKERYIKLTLVIISIIIFYFALRFENAVGTRLIVLISIFSIYQLMNMGMYLIYNKKNYVSFLILLSTICVFLLEYNSKFIINNFFNIFYFFILIESVIILEMKRSLIISSVIILLSFIKYLYVLYFEINFTSISQAIFYVLMNILVLLILEFAKYYLEEKRKKDILYEELKQSHEKLRQYAYKVKEYTIMEERTRVARDLHDTLGHAMTALIMQLEMADAYIEEDVMKSKELLDKSKEQAREGLIKIREVVETLRNEKAMNMCMDSIKQLIDDYMKSTATKIILNIGGEERELTVTQYITIYRTVQEALTNAVRHGKSTEICINMLFKEKQLNIKINDNGIGCNVIKEGYGLKGMRERIELIEGKVDYYNDNGFNIDVVLPINCLKGRGK